MVRSLIRRISERAFSIASRRTAGPVILMYHRIAEESYDPWGLAVSAANFGQQLDWLAVNRVVMPLHVLIELHATGKLPRNACAITFDDGYACNARLAAPMLAERSLCATFFLATRLLDPEREFWWDDLERIVTASHVKRLALDGERGREEWEIGPPNSGDAQRHRDAPPATARQEAIDAIWRFLLPQSPGAIRAQIDDLRRQAAVAQGARASHRPMSAEEAGALPLGTIDFGGHTLHHISLTDRPADEQLHEITTGLAECAALRGEDIATFAYPYGHYNTQSVDIVKGRGLMGACSTVYGPVRRGSDIFALPRIAAGHWNAAMLQAMLAKV